MCFCGLDAVCSLDFREPVAEAQKMCWQERSPNDRHLRDLRHRSGGCFFTFSSDRRSLFER